MRRWAIADEGNRPGIVDRDIGRLCAASVPVVVTPCTGRCLEAFSSNVACMCGVVGFLQPGGFAPREGQTVSSRMADEISHRGPDDSGVWVDCAVGIALAHRRLAVIDLSEAGHQPMLSHSGRYVISFNGEIYNHVELRQIVDSRALRRVAWTGASDTETLVAAIECFGLAKALQLVVGMFAFALWDREDRTLFLARDRMGEKPLYFGWQNGVFMFGSELKALAAHPAFDGEVDREALVLFLRHNYVPSPWSIYKDIRKLEPGTYAKISLTIGDGQVGRLPQTCCYWSLRDAIASGEERPLTGSTDEIVDAVQDVLAKAVARQIVADVPLGAFLSGGIDSSTIVALMQAQALRPVKTFTIGFEDDRYDEAVHARAVAAHLGTDHTELYVSAQDALDVIPRLPALYDEPFSDSSQIPTALVAEMTRRHVTVALSGDGGDELFGGYTRYLRMRDLCSILSPLPARMRRIGGRAITAVPAHWGSGMRVFDKVRTLAELINYETEEQLYLGLVSHWRSPALVVRNALEPTTCISDPVKWPRTSVLESRLMAIDALTYLPDDILVKVDRAAMGVSLETRAPFLDHRVVEFAWRLPLSVKIRGRQGKWALRQVLYRHVPKKLVERRKMGFGVPMSAWLRGPLKDWAESLLDERRLREDGFFCAGPIRDRWAQHIAGRRRWDGCLWDVLMFHAWLDEVR